MRTFTALLLAVTLALGATACGDDETGDGESTTTTAAAAAGDATTTTDFPTASATTAELIVSDSDLGPIVTTAEGMTLYLFTTDTATQSTCVGPCVDAWPPLLTPVTAGEGIDAGQIGEVTRDDGRSQVTYAGSPLYTFANDSSPGDVTGQGSGGVWFVLDADGAPVKESAATDDGY